MIMFWILYFFSLLSLYNPWLMQYEIRQQNWEIHKKYNVKTKRESVYCLYYLPCGVCCLKEVINDSVKEGLTETLRKKFTGYDNREDAKERTALMRVLEFEVLYDDKIVVKFLVDEYKWRYEK